MSDNPNSKQIGHTEKWRHELHNDHDHMLICFNTDGTIEFYPRGNASHIERTLRKIVELFSGTPEAMNDFGAYDHAILINPEDSFRQ